MGYRWLRIFKGQQQKSLHTVELVNRNVGGGLVFDICLFFRLYRCNFQYLTLIEVKDSNVESKCKVYI